MLDWNGPHWAPHSVLISRVFDHRRVCNMLRTVSHRVLVVLDNPCTVSPVLTVSYVSNWHQRERETESAKCCSASSITYTY